MLASLESACVQLIINRERDRLTRERERVKKMKILIFAAIIGIIAANRNDSMASHLKPEVLQRPAPYQILRKAKMMEVIMDLE